MAETRLLHDESGSTTVISHEGDSWKTSINRVRISFDRGTALEDVVIFGGWDPAEPECMTWDLFTVQGNHLPADQWPELLTNLLDDWMFGFWAKLHEFDVLP